MKISILIKLIKLFHRIINLLIRIKVVIYLFRIANLSFVIILRFNPAIIFLIHCFNIENLPILNLNNYKSRVSILFTIKPDIPYIIIPYVINFFKYIKLKLILYVQSSLIIISISK